VASDRFRTNSQPVEVATRVFPVVGTILVTIGLYLMSHIGLATSELIIAPLHGGLRARPRLVMQVLVVAVQNAVTYEELAPPRSGVTFFRMIGGSFGTAVFGAIFGQRARRQSRPVTCTAGRCTHNVASQIGQSQAARSRLAGSRAGVTEAIAHSIDKVFLIAVPIAFVAFLLSWLLPEVELRKSIRTVEPGEGFDVPDARSSLDQIQLSLARISQHETGATSTVHWPPGPGWPSRPKVVFGCSTACQTIRLLRSAKSPTASRSTPSNIEPALEGIDRGGPRRP